MRRESPYPMVSITEAQQIIAAHTAPLGIDEIDIRGEVGRVLAEDIYAAAPLPDVPKAAVDGYALRAADSVAGRRVLAEIRAGGYDEVTIAPGTAARIMTGAPVPPGADAVVMVEHTEEREGVVWLQQPTGPGDNVHIVGQDIAAGELVLARGARLGPAEIGLLATIGRVRVAVYRRPRVTIFATGDEVYEPDAPLAPGAIRDSNRYALLAAARESGCEVRSLGIIPDDLAAQRAAILAGVEHADVLITSGGVSMGTRDLIKPLLAELGAVHFGRIAFKPGKPTTFATIARANQGGTPNMPALAFGLPGYPVSSLVSFEVFVRPALRRMQGDAHPERPRVQVVLRDAIKAPADRPECQRAIVSWEEGRLVARSTGAQGSSRLLSLRGANALLMLPGRGEVYQAGDVVEALLMGPIAY